MLASLAAATAVVGCRDDGQQTEVEILQQQVAALTAEKENLAVRLGQVRRGKLDILDEHTVDTRLDHLLSLSPDISDKALSVNLNMSIAAKHDHSNIQVQQELDLIRFGAKRDLYTIKVLVPKKGERLEEISQQYGVPTQEIIRVTNLFVGHKIFDESENGNRVRKIGDRGIVYHKYPVIFGVCRLVEGEKYTVKKGPTIYTTDSFDRIAKQYLIRTGFPNISYSSSDGGPFDDNVVWKMSQAIRLLTRHKGVNLNSDPYKLAVGTQLSLPDYSVDTSDPKSNPKIVFTTTD